ncbi:MAG TPA: hypothetical protein VK973_01180 [Arenicellales bacterium]|nr:hypothetical protein [Arenicellales bacterium]
MQSANQQLENRSDAGHAGAYRPQRFEQQVARSAATIQPLDYPVADRERGETREPRQALAAAFGRLGVAVGADAAFERVRNFYKSSRCRWTLGLR